MRRVLITGMSGTGKSTLIRELAARGYRAIDADEDGLSEIRTVAGTPGAGPEREWLWREDAIERLLSTDEGDVLFLGGCASNQVKFYAQFDHIVLLSAPPDVLIERLATRTTNNFGKDPEELARILEDQRAVEPLLRQRATIEMDTRAPLDQLLDAILVLVRRDDG